MARLTAKDKFHAYMYLYGNIIPKSHFLYAIIAANLVESCQVTSDVSLLVPGRYVIKKMIVWASLRTEAGRNARQDNTNATGDAAVTECHSSSDKLELKRIMRWMWGKRNLSWEKSSTRSTASEIWQLWKWLRYLRTSGEESEQCREKALVACSAFKCGPLPEAWRRDSPGQRWDLLELLTQPGGPQPQVLWSPQGLLSFSLLTSSLTTLSNILYALILLPTDVSEFCDCSC